MVRVQHLVNVTHTNSSYRKGILFRPAQALEEERVELLDQPNPSHTQEPHIPGTLQTFRGMAI